MFPQSKTRFTKATEDFLASTLPDDVKQAFLGLLKLIADCRDDVPLFFERMLGLPVNEFQRKFLERSCTPRRLWKEKFNDDHEQLGGLLYGKNIAFPSNQVGKTVMIAGKHIHRAFYKTGLDLEDALVDRAYYATLNISPHSRQVKQCYGYVKDILMEKFLVQEPGKKPYLNTLHPVMKDFFAGENNTLGEIRFRNRSVFYTVPVGQDQAASLAGGQFGYISYDEAAQSHHLKDELGAKIPSRLIKYGTGLDLISTPEVDAPSHQYYLKIVKEGQRQQNGWWSLGGHLDQNIFIPAEQREMVKKELFATDKNKYRQVVKGEFVTSGSKLFDSLEIERMFRLPGKTACIPGRKYLMVSDWGMADGGDESVHYMLDYTDWFDGGTLKLAAHETMVGGSPHMQFAVARALHDSFTYVPEGSEQPVKPAYVMDANSLGGVTIKKLLASLFPKAFDIEKDEALLMLKKVMSEGRDYYESQVDGAIIERNPGYGKVECYYIEDLSEQLGVYKVDDEGLKQDHVMTLMMGVAYVYQKFKRKLGVAANIDLLASHGAGRNRPAGRRGQQVTVTQITPQEMFA